MARRRKVFPRYKGGNSGRKRKLALTATIRPTGEAQRFAFEACVRVKGGKAECAFAKNPRKALANAVTKLGKSMRKRSGAFAGKR